MDQAARARQITVIREARRSQQRTAELAVTLADPAVAPHLAEVDRRWPGLVDTERARLAAIVARHEPALT